MKFKTLLFLLLISLRSLEVLAATDCKQVIQIPQIECEALIALYNGTNGPKWSYNVGWNTNNTPCDWYGIICDNNHVSEINLNFNELIGSIPAELGKLSNLQYLVLMGNQLSGPIPAELGNLRSLKAFDLSVNQLSGLVPAGLGNLSNLLYLTLYNNQLSGLIPTELSKLSNLLYLMLMNNQLSGPIPAELGKLSNLQELVLMNNQLSGPIPAELGNLSSLTNLLLGNNQLCGNIPLSLINLSKLKGLYLQNNGLNITNLDPKLETFLNNLETDWESQDPSICQVSLVRLASFSAKLDSVGILLEWQTLTEDKNAGFFIWRAQPNSSQCTFSPTDYHDIVLVNFLKDDQEDDFAGATYSYRDNSVKSETSYCYLLEDVGFDGNRTRHWELIAPVTTR